MPSLVINPDKLLEQHIKHMKCKNLLQTVQIIMSKYSNPIMSKYSNPIGPNPKRAESNKAQKITCRNILKIKILFISYAHECALTT